MLEIIKRGHNHSIYQVSCFINKILPIASCSTSSKARILKITLIKNASYLLNAPSRAPKISKTLQASIRAFTAPKMYPKALTFVPAIIFWLILAAILVARLSLAESSTKRDIEFSYQAKMTAEAWGNVLERLDTEITMTTKIGKKCSDSTLLLVISCYFPHPTDLKVRLE